MLTRIANIKKERILNFSLINLKDWKRITKTSFSIFFTWNHQKILRHQYYGDTLCHPFSILLFLVFFYKSWPNLNFSPLGDWNEFDKLIEGVVLMNDNGQIRVRKSPKKLSVFIDQVPEHKMDNSSKTPWQPEKASAWFFSFNWK